MSCAQYSVFCLLHISALPFFFTDICEYFTSGRSYIFINVPLVFIFSGNFTMKKWTTNMLQKMEHPASRAFLSLALFWPTRGRLCKNQIRSLLGMHWMLPGYSFQPRPNIRAHALDTAVSVMTSGLSINGCSHTENQFDERKQDN